MIDQDDDVGAAIDLLRSVIDDALGEGFTRRHPELLGMIYLSGTLERVATRLCEAIDRRDDGSILGDCIIQAVEKLTENGVDDAG